MLHAIGQVMMVQEVVKDDKSAGNVLESYTGYRDMVQVFLYHSVAILV